MIDLKNEIDKELEFLTLSDEFIQDTLDHAKMYKKKKRKRLPLVAAAMLTVLIVGTTSAAGYYIYQAIRVNEQVLPELDSMTVQKFHTIEGLKSIGDDDIPQYERTFDSYSELKDILQKSLLDTSYSKESVLQEVTYTTDGKDYELIDVVPYITGDTTDLTKDANGNCFYSHGKEFFSPVNLRIAIALSREQLNTGLETDYLGSFEFVEQYVSKQGYKVDIVSDNCRVPKYYAIFVADGIQYELSGHVNLEKIKEIVDSMSYHN